MTHEERTPTTHVGRVLIADDDFDFRQLLVRRAVKMGLSVVEVGDGVAAIKALRENAFDVIVVDVYMPGRTGLEVAEIARQEDPHIQALVLTGSASVENAVEALRAGVYDFLTKPLESMAEFELALTRALEHRLLLMENERLFEEVQRLAVTDPLTGLYNRHKLNDVLDTEVERARRYGRPLSLIMVDMDNLKRINDSSGHSAGDLALQLVAQAISSQVRRVDVVSRMGGDEFLVVLPEATRDEAHYVGERIARRVSLARVEGRPVSASMGVIQWLPEHETPELFLNAVDQALYQAKQARAERLASPAAGPTAGRSGRSTRK